MSDTDWDNLPDWAYDPNSKAYFASNAVRSHLALNTNRMSGTTFHGASVDMVMGDDREASRNAAVDVGVGDGSTDVGDLIANGFETLTALTGQEDLDELPPRIKQLVAHFEMILAELEAEWSDHIADA